MDTLSAMPAPDESEKTELQKKLFYICGEVEATETKFRRLLRSGLEKIQLYKDDLIGEGYGYARLTLPSQTILDSPWSSAVLANQTAADDINKMLQATCKNIREATQGNISKAYTDAALNYREFASLALKVVKYKKSSGSAVDEGESLAILPVQRLPRDVLFIKDLLETALTLSTKDEVNTAGFEDKDFKNLRIKKPGKYSTTSGIILPETLAMLKATLEQVMKVADVVNQKKREAELEQTRKMFSFDEEIRDVLIKNGVGMEIPLEPKDEKKVRREIANAIRNGEPEDIKKVLNKYHFSIGVDYARPGEDNPALVKATAIKRDYYCGLIDSRIREKIRETKAPIHAKPNFMTWLRAILHGYTDTTKYIIHEINKAPASLKTLNKYLPVLGLDQSAIVLVTPPPAPAAVAETGSAFNLIHALGVVPQDEIQKSQSDSSIPKPPPSSPLSSPSNEPEEGKKDVEGKKQGRITGNQF